MALEFCTEASPSLGIIIHPYHRSPLVKCLAGQEDPETLTFNHSLLVVIPATQPSQSRHHPQWHPQWPGEGLLRHHQYVFFPDIPDAAAAENECQLLRSSSCANTIPFRSSLVSREVKRGLSLPPAPPVRPPAQACSRITCLLFGIATDEDVLKQTARIIANAPLRAKEASPFVSTKYPVIVSTLFLASHSYKSLRLVLGIEESMS